MIPFLVLIFIRVGILGSLADCFWHAKLGLLFIFIHCLTFWWATDFFSADILLDLFCATLSNKELVNLRHGPRIKLKISFQTLIKWWSEINVILTLASLSLLTGLYKLSQNNNILPGPGDHESGWLDMTGADILPIVQPTADWPELPHRIILQNNWQH